jgi:periplasmic protein CpxP/Spy
MKQVQSRLLLAAGCLAGLTVLGGFAGGCGHHPRDPAEAAAFVKDRVDDALDDVSATADQRQQIQAVADRLLAAGQALHQDGAPLHAELLAQWQSPNPDRARLHALVDQRLDALRALAHQAVDAGIEVHDVLTPEQRAKVQKRVERMHRFHP